MVQKQAPESNLLVQPDFSKKGLDLQIVKAKSRDRPGCDRQWHQPPGTKMAKGFPLASGETNCMALWPFIS